MLSIVWGRCFHNCTDDACNVRQDKVSMGRELSNKIDRNFVGFSMPTAKGYIDAQEASPYDKATGAGMPTPHVQFRKIDIGPNGQVATSKKTEVTRAATKEDLRVARRMFKYRAGTMRMSIPVVEGDERWKLKLNWSDFCRRVTSSDFFRSE